MRFPLRNIPLRNIPLPILLASAGIFLLIIIALTVYQFSKPKKKKEIEYGVLYTDIKPNDFTQIIDELERSGIPYKISETGDTIFIPKELIPDVRNNLAKKGLPEGRVGLEIFETPKFGMTEFMQKVNLQRAIQSELERTIMKINCVENARVHITMPQPRLFVEEEKNPTASVMLWITPGCTIPRESIRGIENLVAAAVEGLKPENITIIDQRGKPLNKKLTEEEEQGEFVQKQLDLERETERKLEEKITELLEKSIGKGKVGVKVDVDLDFTKVKRVAERYNPYETAVRSEQKIEEKFKGVGAVPVGPPGVRENVPPTIGIEPYPGTSQYEKNEIVRNYEISKVVEQTEEEVGNIKRLSVAVMVDGLYDIEYKDGKPYVKFTPLPPQELGKIEDFVKAAVGINPARGDQVSVVSVPFENSVRYAERLAMFKSEQETRERESMFKWIAIAAIGFFISLYLIIRKLAERRIPQEVEVVLPKTIREEVPIYIPVEAPPPPPPPPVVEAPPPPPTPTPVEAPEVIVEEIAPEEIRIEEAPIEEAPIEVVEVAPPPPPPPPPVVEVAPPPPPPPVVEVAVPTPPAEEIITPPEIELLPEIKITPPPPEIGPDPLDEAIELVSTNPDIVVEIIKQWIREEIKE